MQNKPVASPVKVLNSRQLEQPIWRFRLRSNNRLLTCFSLLTFVCFVQQAFPFHFNNDNEIRNRFMKLLLVWTAGLLWWAFACTFDWLNRVTDQYFPHSHVLTRSSKTKVVSGRENPANSSNMARARIILHTLDHFVNYDYRLSAAFMIMLECLAQVWVFNVPLWESKIPESRFLQQALRTVLSIAIFLHTYDTLREAVIQHGSKDTTYRAIKNQAPQLSKKLPKAPAQKKKNDYADKRLRMNMTVEDFNRKIQLKHLKDELAMIDGQRYYCDDWASGLSRARGHGQGGVMEAEKKVLGVAKLAAGIERIERALEAEMGGLAPAVD
ncbi:MAG: hypothetical protein L6R37_006763 [Teloschistes peruensis]|nr:MAG: hypothetical protein L6R37_006763 [Teloschistes peruensis]